MADPSAGIAYLQLVRERSNARDLPPIHILPALPEYGTPKYSIDEGESLSRKMTAGSRRSHQVGARVKAFFRRDASLELPRGRHVSYPTSVFSDDDYGRKSRDSRAKSIDEVLVSTAEIHNGSPGGANKMPVVPTSATNLSKIPIPDDSHEANNFTALGLSAPRPPTPPRSRQPRMEPILSPQKVREFEHMQRRSEDQPSPAPPQREPPPIPHLERHLSPFGSPVFGPKSPRRSVSRASTFRPFSLQIERDGGQQFAQAQAQGLVDDRDRASFDFDSSTLTENPKQSSSSPGSPVNNLAFPNPKLSEPLSRKPSPTNINITAPNSGAGIRSSSRFTNLSLTNLFSPSQSQSDLPESAVPSHDETTCPLQHDLSTSQSQNAALKSCLETNLASQTTLKSRLASSLSRIEVLSSRLTTAQSSAATAVRKSEALSAQLARLNTENSNLRVELATWRRRHEEVELALMKEAARGKSLKGSLEERDYEMEGYRLRVEVLEGKVRSLKGERDLLRRENEGLWGLLDFEPGGVENTPGPGPGDGKMSTGRKAGREMGHGTTRPRGKSTGAGGSGSGSAGGSKYQDRYERQRSERERELENELENEYGRVDEKEYGLERLTLDTKDEFGNGQQHGRGRRQSEHHRPMLDRYEHQDDYVHEPLPLRLGRGHGGEDLSDGNGSSPGRMSENASPISGLFGRNGNANEAETANVPSMPFEQMIRGLRGAGSDDDDDGGGLLGVGLREHVGYEHGDGEQLELEGEDGLYSAEGQQREDRKVGEHGIEVGKRR